ncbi:Spy/CpxP family protein refolding chaperone [Devosia sp. ZB163]|uniref:Spy/CpxP family protein refolding chaperone n=1 Tax=Devosia sp. ZB163 TaxID=3025938 RepID=UPI00235DCF84|nr:Spy/CpxP family protein refolding chaperone [Devosia sp. ZB163]MDC9825706.1 Spy/CpxP family protein refolding chaperone [Devosia sp. ZB163]
MTPTRASLFAALVAALGLTAMSPTFAAGPQHQRHDTGRMLEFRRDGGAFRFAQFSCNDRAADRLERRLDRMAGRLELTKEQEKLFEDFRTSALTAQTEFADQCDTIRPGATASKERADLIQRLEQRLKFDEARLAAMSELLPHFKTFYGSLTDTQKHELMPGRGMDQPHAPRPGAQSNG